MESSMKPVASSSDNAPRRSALSSFVAKLWESAPQDAGAKRPIQAETLEPRLLLSADITTPGLAAALDAGLDAFGDRVQDFVDADVVLNTPLPIVVTAGLNDDD